VITAAGSTLARSLKLLFERTSKGTRITTAPFAPLDDKVIRTVFPLLITSASTSPLEKFGRTESATVSLTVACNVTRPVCAFAAAGRTSINAVSVKT